VWTFYLVAIYTVAAVACASRPVFTRPHNAAQAAGDHRLGVAGPVQPAVRDLPDVTAGIIAALILGAGWGSYAAVTRR